MRIGLAFRCFFNLLFGGALSSAVLAELGLVKRAAAPAARAAAPAAVRTPADGALQILGILQRDSRLVDFLMEDIDVHADEQVGAAVREVHKQCRESLARYVRLEPVIDGVEGTFAKAPSAAHPLPDDVQRDLEVGERATRDAREDGDYLVARELVAPEVEALARKVIRVLEDAGRDGPDVRDSDSRERPRPWEWRGVDALRELLLAEIEVLHEKDGGEDRGAHADLGDVLLDLVLAVEVRNARLSICGADRREDEMHACRLGRVGGGDALMRLGLRASPEWRGHREEGGGSFERLRHCGRVLERRAYERDPRLCELLRLLGVGGTRDRMNLVASLEKTFHYCATLIARGSRDDDDQLLTHGSCLLRARDTRSEEHTSELQSLRH